LKISLGLAGIIGSTDVDSGSDEPDASNNLSDQADSFFVGDVEYFYRGSNQCDGVTEM
jgi:hypothetical protein